MAEDHFVGDSRTNRERTLAGDLYVSDDPESFRLAQRGVRVQEADRAKAAEGEAAAVEILAELVGTLGEGAFIKAPLYVDYGENLHVGERTFVNDNLTALPLTIGRQPRPDRQGDLR